MYYSFCTGIAFLYFTIVSQTKLMGVILLKEGVHGVCVCLCVKVSDLTQNWNQEFWKNFPLLKIWEST